MPLRKTVEDFIALVESGRMIEAYQRFYHDDAVARENQAPARQGLVDLIRHEKRMLAAFHNVEGVSQGAPLIHEDRVAINWRFEFLSAAGATLTLDEVALQVWSGEKIKSEQFYYDPAQMTPVSTPVGATPMAGD